MSSSHSYSTTFETSNQPVTDIFHFSVLDADNNRLDRQMFTVTITSAPALIAFADHVTVSAWGQGHGSECLGTGTTMAQMGAAEQFS